MGVVERKMHSMVSMMGQVSQLFTKSTLNATNMLNVNLYHTLTHNPHVSLSLPHHSPQPIKHTG